jgi:hypothetical protein
LPVIGQSAVVNHINKYIQLSLLSSAPITAQVALASQNGHHVSARNDFNCKGHSWHTKCHWRRLVTELYCFPRSPSFHHFFTLISHRPMTSVSKVTHIQTLLSTMVYLNNRLPSTWHKEFTETHCCWSTGLEISRCPATRMFLSVLTKVIFLSNNDAST